MAGDCIPTGQMVYTKDGIKPIEDIAVGEEVVCASIKKVQIAPECGSLVRKIRGLQKLCMVQFLIILILIGLLLLR
jgi:hypothetical protein